MLRTIALVTSVVAVIVACGILALLLVHTGFDYWKDVIKEHFLGTIGLVGISYTAFGIVTFLRQSEGPMEFEGMKFKGAAGQVILWGFCTIVLTICAKLLW
jgi:NO-binding membrane sensor protein with MHYT domain